MPRLILMGPPGAGKGTQGKRVAAELHIPIISMGDLLRVKKNEASALGAQIKEIMAAGRYVPDEVVIEMIRERVTEEDCRDGYILDGFPRTVAQADALDRLTEDLGQALDLALLIEVPEEDLVRRLSGRRICPECGSEYHVEFRRPKRDMLCDHDGAALIQREDDQEATIRKRLEVYLEHTTPLAEYYRRKGLLQVVNGVGAFDDVYARAIGAVRDASA